MPLTRIPKLAGVVVTLLWGVVAQESTAQGQDSSPGARHLQIMAELLPGRYDNVNQHYFDTRRNLPQADRHARIHTRITRVQAPALGPYVFLWVNETEKPTGVDRSYRVATLAAGPAADEVTMTSYFRMQGPITAEELATLRPAELITTPGCEYTFKRRADHYRGLQSPGACRFDWMGDPVYGENEISLSRTSLWFVDHKFLVKTGQRITGVASGEPFWQERARVFHCYADVPGVGGGRDLPFERHDHLELHDKGGSVTFRTREARPREVVIRLQAVTWHVLNEANDEFNRDSLVLYAHEKMADGTLANGGYVFTDPEATRIGNNLGWMLVNCAMTRRSDVRPQM